MDRVNQRQCTRVRVRAVPVCPGLMLALGVDVIRIQANVYVICLKVLGKCHDMT